MLSANDAMSVFASKSSQNPSLLVPILPCRTQLLLDSVSFAPEKVENVLSTLDFDSATEPDGIHSSVLKICSAGLAFPRSAFFTLPFVPGHLASAWKSAHITTLSLNYRCKVEGHSVERKPPPRNA